VGHQEGTVVNNESREILRILSTAFDDLGNDASLLPTPTTRRPSRMSTR